MSLDDMLLHIDSYPDPTPEVAIDQAVEFARLVGGRLSALAVAIDIPDVSNRLADYLVGLSKLEQQEEAKSRKACQTAIEHFTTRAKSAGVFSETHIEKAALAGAADHVARRARTRDLCLVPLADRFDGQAEVASAALFDSGRPVLVYKADKQNFARGALEEVVLAWDGGRSAARAMADALPVLKKAKAVRLLSIVHEKPSVIRGAGAEALRHLQSHGIQASVDEVDGSGRPIGRVMDEYLEARRPDLLVMGGYGHSRLREFVLGGATDYALENAPVPILLSH